MKTHAIKSPSLVNAPTLGQYFDCRSKNLAVLRLPPPQMEKAFSMSDLFDRGFSSMSSGGLNKPKRDEML